MGTKNQKGSVSIGKVANRIRLRWRFQKKRFSLSLFLFSKSNLAEAKKIASQIERDLVLNSFDVTLKKYRPLAGHEFPSVHNIKTLVEHFQDWVRNYRNMDCEKDIDYNSSRNMMLRWGSFDSSTVLMHFNNEKIGAKTYNRRLQLLNSFFKYTVKKKITDCNPFEDVLPRKIRKTDKPNRKPFTEDEIKRILEAFKNDIFIFPSSGVKHSHYYPFIYFLFALGVRNAEAIGIRVQHVDVKKNLIYIKEVLARTVKRQHKVD